MPQDDQSPTTPRLHIDSDWKAQAQAEKERLAKQEQESKSAADQHSLPPASFQSLISVLASQAIMGLGTMADPKSGRIIVDLEGARFSIDLLGVLEEKTKGNRSKEEDDDLRQVLAELRNRYVQIVQLVAQQQQKAAAGGATAAADPDAPVGVIRPG
jgi:hypothetical protein